MDRWQVDDVEPELGEPRQLALDSLQPAPRAREHLIPGAEPGPEPVDLDCSRFVEHHDVAAICTQLDRGVQLLAERHVVLGAVGDLGVLELAVCMFDHRSVSV